MRLGIDFDNTIARYDGLFQRLAVERGLVEPDFPADKTAIRDHLRATGREDDWTLMQGTAYGPRITDAEPFPGVCDFFRRATDAGLDLRIISHKTRTPYAGPPHDLHAAAGRFLDHHGISPRLLPTDRVFLEPTKAAKIARIREQACTHFIDDLPEFLAEPDFPDIAKLHFGGPYPDWATLSVTLLPDA